MGGPQDTSLGGSAGAFPSTMWSVLDDLKHRRAPDPQAAMARLVTRYWKPVYAYVRLAWKQPNEEAKDLTQQFFLHLMEAETLQAADPRRGRFRSFLKTVLQNFLCAEHRKEGRLKRGGGAAFVSIDLPDAQVALPSDPAATPEEVFDREWARALMEEVVGETAAQLGQAGRADQWGIFEAHDLADGEPPAYDALAARFQVTPAQVKHLLREVRGRVRDSVIQKIREYALDDQEVWEELDQLLKVWRGR